MSTHAPLEEAKLIHYLNQIPFGYSVNREIIPSIQVFLPKANFQKLAKAPLPLLSLILYSPKVVP